MPVAFVAHGAPTLALDQAKGAELQRWALSMPRPRAIAVVSAHWEHSPPCLGTLETRELVYDFYGFPEALYRLRYPCPGAPELAREVASLLEAHGLECAHAPGRGLDHGAWVPLLHMYPEADLPVLQIAQPRSPAPRAFFELGRALAPLRERGVLILASGNLTHNLGALDWSGNGPVPAWALAFDRWCQHTLADGDLEALLAYRERAPEWRRAHPSEEHLTPLLAAAGAAATGPREVRFPVAGFEYGSLSRRCVQFG